MLESLFIIILQSMSTFKSINICFKWLSTLEMDIYIYWNNIFSLNWSLISSSLSLSTIFALMSIFSGLRMAIPMQLLFLLVESVFSHLFTFSLCVSLLLRYIPCKQQIDGACFLIYSSILSILIGKHRPLYPRISLLSNDSVPPFFIKYSCCLLGISFVSC